MDANEVNEAFEILLEEIEAVANDLNESGAEALRAGDYQRAEQAIQEAKRLSEFRDRVKALQKEWKTVTVPARPRSRQISRRRLDGRLRRGLRTTEDAFRRPLLEALHELGGSASVAEVLDLVEQKMRGILNEYDHQPLPSSPTEPRWRNTAQWCRYTLVREGLLKSDSPHGIWELSEAGRKELGV